MQLAPIQPTPWFSSLRMRWKKPVRHDWTNFAPSFYRVFRTGRKKDEGLLRELWNKIIGRPKF